MQMFSNISFRRSMRPARYVARNRCFNMVVAAGASDDVVSGLSWEFNLHKYGPTALRALRRHQSFSRGVEHGVPFRVFGQSVWTKCLEGGILCFREYMALFCFGHVGVIGESKKNLLHTPESNQKAQSNDRKTRNVPVQFRTDHVQRKEYQRYLR